MANWLDYNDLIVIYILGIECRLHVVLHRQKRAQFNDVLV